MKQLSLFAVSTVLLGLLLLSATIPAHTITAAGPTPTNSLGPITISLGEPQQLFHAGEPDALGMQGVPDQPLTPILQPDNSYRLFIAGGKIGGIRGTTGLISTNDFLKYMPVVGSSTEAKPVFMLSCPGNPEPGSCKDNYDANYAGVDLVFSSSYSKNLLMIYQGTTTSDRGFYSVVALAVSTNNGLSWSRQGAIITGSDPKLAILKPGANGADQSGAIVANGYIYDFYPYFPSRGTDRPTIQVARAPISGDGAPGTWTKYYNGAFGTQPGLGGLGSPVISETSACTRPVQPWLAFSTYLNRYIISFICAEGWFFSTSTDLVNWTPQTQYFVSPAPMFSKDQPTNENVSFVSPGYPGQVIDQTGYILYANTPAWGKDPHELWMRSFTFNR